MRSDGSESDGASGNPTISADGQFVGFESNATNLVAGDSNAEIDVFVFDRDLRTTERVSVGSGGAQSDSTSEGASLSGDGRYISFTSNSTTFAPGTGDILDVYIHDRVLNTTTLITNSSGGEGFFIYSATGTSLSFDGSYLAFESDFVGLVPGDSNEQFDVFGFDATTQSMSSISFHSGGTSTTSVLQTTIAGTADADYYAGGRIALVDVLVAGTDLGLEPSRPSLTNVIGRLEGSEQVGSLTTVDGSPPVVPLLAGNGAIDAGSTVYRGSLDQRGVQRLTPDVGAFEALQGSVSGTVFVDENRNQIRDPGELRVPGIDALVKNPLDGDELARVTSAGDDPATPSENEAGLVTFDSLPVGSYVFDVEVPPGWTRSRPAIARVPAIQANGRSYDPTVSTSGDQVSFVSDASDLVSGDNQSFGDLFVFDRVDGGVTQVVRGLGFDTPTLLGGHDVSGDGRFVAFSSDLPTFVAGDFNFMVDVFVYDRLLDEYERVSVTDGGQEVFGMSYFPAINEDGRFVAFVSEGPLVPSDTNNAPDVYVRDRQLNVTERVSIASDGTQGNASSGGSLFGSFLIGSVAISTDGRFVTFESDASNLVPGDTNGATDLFLHDRDTGVTQRVSRRSDGGQANDSSSFLSMSGDGNFIAFESDATNLDPNDTNGVADIFLFDVAAGTVTRVAEGDRGSLSDDGRFLAFSSDASGLVEGDENNTHDVFIYDRVDGLISRVSLGLGGAEPNASSRDPAISGDGALVYFESAANNLVPGDTNGVSDIFVAANPLIRTERTVKAGDQITDLEFGLIPDPGSISGTLFEDVIPNGRLDAGETLFSGWTVFLDIDGNGVLDDGELSTRSLDDGSYRFESAPGFRGYDVLVQIPSGFEQVAPLNGDELAHQVFLPPAAEIDGRDFAFREVTGTGQAGNSSVSGRLYEDRNGNGLFDTGDLPLVDTVVFLDADNPGVRDPNEPAVLTDSEGRYTIGSLGSSIASVSTLLDEDVTQLTPLGSDFQLGTYPLFSQVQPFTNPQFILPADFNGDGFPDVAVSLGDSNRISIRLNDGQAGFAPDQVNIDLGAAGAGPTSMVVGQFNGPGTPLDLAVVNNFASNVTILTDFNGSGFDSTATVPVGVEPLDLVSAAITGSSDHLDLIVVNQDDNTIQTLLNNGSGTFTAAPPVATGGLNAVSIVAGHFDADANVDVAVAHSVSSVAGSALGDVRVLLGDGLGGFTLTPQRYQVGALPIDMVAGNFDNDPGGKIDIAVSNFSSNSLSILTSNGDGTLTVQSQTLGTSSGAFDVTAGDVDNDGDVDLVASNLLDRNISIFRNSTTQPGVTNFQSLEGVGLGQFGSAQRMPLALANFDQDTGGPASAGTLDIVAIPRLSETLHVLTNTLVNGSHRVELTGLNQVDGLDFIVAPSVLPPAIDEIADPAPIDEDSGPQVLELTGIRKGRDAGPPLQFVATSSDTNLIADPVISHVDGQTDATLSFASVADAVGSATITVSVTDAGSDGVIGTLDDSTATVSFTVTIEPVNDAPTFDLGPTVTRTQKSGLQIIDGFLTNLSPGGGADEASQTFGAIEIATDSSFFASDPVIDAQGRLTFAPDPNRQGAVLVQVTVSDDGGSDSGGRDRTTKAFVIHLLPVNEAPSIQLGADVTVSANAGAQAIPGFATAFDPGGGSDEDSQVISDFVVSTDLPNLFLSVPRITNAGTLEFEPSPDASGTATVTVQVRDNGGTVNGGVDLSDVKVFLINFGPANPIVEAIQTDDGSGQRSMVRTMTVSFDRLVTVAPGAFTITKLGENGGPVSPITTVVSNVNGKTRVDLSFSETPGGNGSLIDGEYQLHVDANRIFSGTSPLDGGSGPGSNLVDDFFRLFGDQDGNGTVNLFDFAAFRSAFGTSDGDVGFDASFDSDANGAINLFDFAAFRGNFGRSSGD